MPSSGSFRNEPKLSSCRTLINTSLRRRRRRCYRSSGSCNGTAERTRNDVFAEGTPIIFAAFAVDRITSQRRRLAPFLPPPRAPQSPCAWHLFGSPTSLVTRQRGRALIRVPVLYYPPGRRSSATSAPGLIFRVVVYTRACHVVRNVIIIVRALVAPAALVFHIGTS